MRVVLLSLVALFSSVCVAQTAKIEQVNDSKANGTFFFNSDYNDPMVKIELESTDGNIKIQDEFHYGSEIIDDNKFTNTYLYKYDENDAILGYVLMVTKNNVLIYVTYNMGGKDYELYFDNIKAIAFN